MLALMGKNACRNISTVESVANRLEACVTVVTGSLLFITEKLECRAEIRLHESTPERGHFAAGHPDVDVVRPISKVVGVLAHVVEHHRMPWEALRSILHGTRRHIAVAHAAPSGEGLQTGVGSGRHYRAANPEGDAAAVRIDKAVHVQCPRPAAHAGDRPGLTAIRQVNDHRRDPGDTHLIAVDDAEREDGGDTGVDRVAAAFEHLESGQGRQIMAGADSVVMSKRNRYDRHEGPEVSSRGASPGAIIPVKVLVRGQTRAAGSP